MALTRRGESPSTLHAPGADVAQVRLRREERRGHRADRDGHRRRHRVGLGFFGMYRLLLVELADFPMMRRCLLNIKCRAEALALARVAEGQAVTEGVQGYD